jgi:hypothetical protein
MLIFLNKNKSAVKAFVVLLQSKNGYLTSFIIMVLDHLKNLNLRKNIDILYLSSKQIIAILNFYSLSTNKITLESIFLIYNRIKNQYLNLLKYNNNCLILNFLKYLYNTVRVLNDTFASTSLFF